MIWGISLIILSLLAVPSLIIKRQPNAKEILDKLRPYQGWIGIVLGFFGIIGLLSVLSNLYWLRFMPIWWLTLLAGSLIELVLGFMLAYGLIAKHLLNKNEKAKEKADKIMKKLASIQGGLGIIGIIVGIWMIIASFVFYTRVTTFFY